MVPCCFTFVFNCVDSHFMSRVAISRVHVFLHTSHVASRVVSHVVDSRVSSPVASCVGSRVVDSHFISRVISHIVSFVASECKAGYSGTFPSCTACPSGTVKSTAGNRGTCVPCPFGQNTGGLSGQSSCGEQFHSFRCTRAPSCF